MFLSIVYSHSLFVITWSYGIVSKPQMFTKTIMYSSAAFPNGYDNPRQYIDYRYKGRGVNKAGLSKSVVLKLPYISETVSDEIRKFICNRNLPVNVIFKPGVKLQDLFCSSRPHDKRKCTLADCKICPHLPDSCDCTVEYPVYRITCQLCSDIYISPISASPTSKASKSVQKTSRNVQKRLNMSKKRPKSVQKASKKRLKSVQKASKKRLKSVQKASKKRPKSVQKAPSKRPKSVQKASKKCPNAAKSVQKVAKSSKFNIPSTESFFLIF